eukprot:1145653-Pelagomonas_calceolata.AAC.6
MKTPISWKVDADACILCPRTEHLAVWAPGHSKKEANLRHMATRAWSCAASYVLAWHVSIYLR